MFLNYFVLLIYNTYISKGVLFLVFHSLGRIVEYLQKVHEYMGILTYNHTGTQFFETKPNR